MIPADLRPDDLKLRAHQQPDLPPELVGGQGGSGFAAVLVEAEQIPEFDGDIPSADHDRPWSHARTLDRCKWRFLRRTAASSIIMTAMPVVFFSYARGDHDPYLEEFFKDVCAEIAPSVPFEAESEDLSFRDRKSLRLGENWQSHIEGALQSTAVLVCMTSVKYFNSEFCGKEYYFFDARRRQGLAPNQDPPPVILPVVWAPVQGGLPDFMNEVHQLPAGVRDNYRTVGLRRLKREKSSDYDTCVNSLADAIVGARQNHPAAAPLPGHFDFAQVPNRFVDGDWQEAAGPNGWLRGPEVANFVFAAGLRDASPAPRGRYGDRPADWRPYLPPELTTIFEHARNVTREKFKFRELPVDEALAKELALARERKNLTVVVADPRMLTSPRFGPVRAIENVWWEGTAVVIPCDDTVARGGDARLPADITVALPVISQSNTVNLVAVDSHQALQPTLDLTLTQLRAAVTKAETDKKGKTDAPPADVRAAG